MPCGRAPTQVTERPSLPACQTPAGRLYLANPVITSASGPLFSSITLCLVLKSDDCGMLTSEITPLKGGAHGVHSFYGGGGGVGGV